MYVLISIYMQVETKRELMGSLHLLCGKKAMLEFSNYDLKQRTYEITHSYLIL